MRISWPHVGIIIVNWNGKNFLIQLLDCLLSLNYPNYTVYVVDNASYDGSVEAAKEHACKVDIIQSESNLGGTGGFNLGMKTVIGKGHDFLWLLDNDTLVEPDSLKRMVATMLADDRIGMVGSKILNKDDPRFIVSLGALVDWTKAYAYPYKGGEYDDGCEEVVDVDYVYANCCLVRTEAVRQIGLMSVFYFVRADDGDWGLRFAKGGYRVVATGQAISYHPNLKEKFYYSCRNTLLFFLFNTTNKLRKNILLYILLRRYLRRWTYYVIRKNRKAARSMYNAIFDFLLGKLGKYKLRSKNIFQKIDKHYLDNNSINRILILPPWLSIERDIILKNIRVMFPHAKVDVLVSSNNIPFDETYKNCNIIRYHTDILSKLGLLLKVNRDPYDLVYVGHGVSIMAFCGKYVAIAEDDKLQYSANTRLVSLILFLLAQIVVEISAPLLLLWAAVISNKKIIKVSMELE